MTDLPPVAPAFSARTSTSLLAASTLCWAWGVLLFLVTLALGIPFLAMKMYQALILPIIFLMLCAAYIVAGVTIRRRRKWGAIVGMAVAVVYDLLAAIGLAAGLASPRAAETGNTTLQTLLTGVLGLGVNTGILVLVIVRWRELEE